MCRLLIGCFTLNPYRTIERKIFEKLRRFPLKSNKEKEFKKIKNMDGANLEKFGVKPDVPPLAGAQNSNDKIAALAACLSYIEGLESALGLWGAANLHIEKPPGV